MEKSELVDAIDRAIAGLIVRPYGGNPRSPLYALREALEEPEKCELYCPFCGKHITLVCDRVT